MPTMKRLFNLRFVAFCAASCFLHSATAFAQQPNPETAGEANLRLPDLSQAVFFGSIDGRSLLLSGLIVVALGLLFGLVIYRQLKNLPVHE